MRKDRTLRVFLREASCLIVVAIAYVSVAEQRSGLLVITQMCRRKKNDRFVLRKKSTAGL